MSKREDGTIVFDAVIYTKDANVLKLAGIEINSVLPNFVTAKLTRLNLVNLMDMEEVEYVEPPVIDYIHNDVARGYTGVEEIHSGAVNNTSYKGEDVIVCIIDTGIDWEHKDFRDPVDDTQSRILYIWDQSIETPIGGEVPPSETGCGYGVEYTQAHIEDEIDGSPAGFVREQDTHGHGTHVTGSAAGNGASLSPQKYGGMAPESDIIFIKAYKNGTFISTDIINGLSYAQQKAQALGRPIVVNMSLGGHDYPHDGTDAKSQAIDNFTASANGRVVVVSAGNDGNNDIHISGAITASGGTLEITFTVNSYTPSSGPDNDYFVFKVWFDAGVNVSAQVSSPDGGNGSFSYSRTQGLDGSNATIDGTIYIDNNMVTNRYIDVQIIDSDASYPPDQGTWTLTLTNNSVSSQTVHGWLYAESIDPTLNGGDSDYTLGNTAGSAIIVGSYVDRWRWYSNSGGTHAYSEVPDKSDDISSFSSKGPTRTGGQRPDIVAPGQGIGSSLSQDASISASWILPGSQHYLTQGTSMSSPVTAGAVALMLDQNASLSASEINNLITENADTDGYTGGVWNSTWGYGKINILKALDHALDSGSSADREILAYDEWNVGNVDLNTGSFPIALRFTPNINGNVAGLFFHLGSSVSLSGGLNVEIYSNSGGVPGSKIGNTVLWDHNTLLNYSWNYIDLKNADAAVSSSTEYHVVITPTSGTMIIFADNSANVSPRSAYYSGTWNSWSTDFRIRPVVSTGDGVYAQIKIYLEGPYSSGSMTTALNSGGHLPLTSPYSEDPRSVSSIPASITDWILLQLRTTSDGTAVASQSAFLRNDGYIVADDGITTSMNLDVGEGNYYIVLDHRNHLGIMSTNTVALNSSSTLDYNFTTSSTQTYGSDAVKDLGSGVWGMYAGNADNTVDVINAFDYSEVKSHFAESEYLNSDIDLSSIVNGFDYSITKTNFSKSSKVP